MDLDKWMVLWKETQKLYYNHNVWDPKSLYLQRFSFIVESSSSVGSEDVPFRNGSTMQKEDTQKAINRKFAKFLAQWSLQNKE